MSILQIVKYDALEGVFPERMRPSLQDHLHLSSQLFQRRRVKPTIRFVVTAPPPQRPGISIVFHAFATNRTAFGAIQDLESIFADWFLETRILPIINPIPMKYYGEPEMLPKDWYSSISVRGVKIYSHAP
ncbi:MAG: hypothetical protein MN733_11025 [Nitrososphaera sp.]|nr:hypothetical protein [Nitrososphaera sp.]